MGSPPFTGENYNILIARILTQDPPRVRELHPTLPEPLAALIEGGLVRDRDARAPTAAALAERLRGAPVAEAWSGRACTATDLLLPVVRPLSDRPPRLHDTGRSTVEAVAVPRRRSRWLLGAALASVLAVGGVAAGLASRSPAASAAPPAPAPPEPAAPPPATLASSAAPPPSPATPAPQEVGADPAGPTLEESPQEQEPEEHEPEPEEAAAVAPPPRRARRTRRAPAPSSSAPERRGFVIERDYD